MKTKIKILAETTGHYEDLLGGALMDGDENVITVKEALDAMQLWGEEIAEGIKKGLPYFDKPKNECTPSLGEEIIDTLIKKHLAEMHNGLERLSIQNFIDTGKISGSFLINIRRFAKEVNKLSQPSQESDRDKEEVK